MTDIEVIARLGRLFMGLLILSGVVMLISYGLAWLTGGVIDDRAVKPKPQDWNDPSKRETD